MRQPARTCAGRVSSKSRAPTTFIMFLNIPPAPRCCCLRFGNATALRNWRRWPAARQRSGQFGFLGALVSRARRKTFLTRSVFLELQPGRLDAIAKTWRFGAIVEDVTEVRLAAAAPNPRSAHSVSCIPFFFNGLFRRGGVETRPTRA